MQKKIKALPLEKNSHHAKVIEHINSKKRQNFPQKKKTKREPLPKSDQKVNIRSEKPVNMKKLPFDFKNPNF